MSQELEYNDLEERENTLKSFGLYMTDIERFLESRNLRVPNKNENFYFRVAEQLDENQFEELIFQYRYAGRQTINYFLIEGLNDKDLGEVKERVESRLPSDEDIESAIKKPYLAESNTVEGKLYFAIGYKEKADSVEPATGKKSGIVLTKRNVVVIYDDMDLIEVRGSDEKMAEEVRDEICDSIGKYKKSVKSRPNFGTKFQEKFEKMVETYLNLVVKVDDQEETTLDTISFTSKEDESGSRKDARKSDRVEEELSERGSEITQGYVELFDGFRFRINRDASKLSFMKAEKEENINQITRLIHDVLTETREHSQRKISGIADVPE
ncbi:hypothetical protein [Natrialba hulunbeirensis]|nr:hypothetical protein [Natrialba hulunbeirensis]